MSTKDSEWSLVIYPKRNLLDVPVREIIGYRDLIRFLILRDFTVQYKQTILGPVWYIISPLFSAIMYAFIFGNLAAIGTNGIPHILFYYCGTMLWSLFAEVFTRSMNTFTDNKDVFSKVYFPRLCTVIASVVGRIIKLLIQTIFFLCFYIYYLCKGVGIVLSFTVLLYPVVVLWIVMLGTGMGLIISSLTTKYRDLKLLVEFALGLAMYATPVVYPITEIPQSLSWLVLINPMSAPLEVFRFAFFGVNNITAGLVLISLAETALFLFLGIILFNKNEQNFIDVF